MEKEKESELLMLYRNKTKEALMERLIMLDTINEMLRKDISILTKLIEELHFSKKQFSVQNVENK